MGVDMAHHHSLHHAKAMPGPFASKNVGLLAHLPLSAVPGSHAAGTDVWGYVSPSGREYAILGMSNGTAFIEVTDPENPVVLDVLPHINACCSDAKTYLNYCYIVSEGDNIGMKIVDLSAIDSGIVTQVGTYTGAGLKQAHNLAINEESGFAYVVGAVLSPALGGIIALDLANPVSPVLRGIWTQQYVPDLQVVNYTTGPHAGKEIAFAYSGYFTTRLRVMDVTNKADMRVIGVGDYPNAEFAHQGWLSDDRRYLYLNDEFDELDYGLPTSTHLFDVSDITKPKYLRSFGSGLGSTDHNLMVQGKFVFQANYTSGLRIFRIDTPSLIKEVGWFDTHPQNNAAGFNGAWGIYTKLPSGNVLVSDIQNGLFILDASMATADIGVVPAVSWPGLCALLILLIAAFRSGIRQNFARGRRKSSL
jgi:choice-of-anchor B domain-containing protein